MSKTAGSAFLRFAANSLFCASTDIHLGANWRDLAMTGRREASKLPALAVVLKVDMIAVVREERWRG